MSGYDDFGDDGADATKTAVQAEAKADAKVAADAVVATNPHATHHVKLAVESPEVLVSTAAGAGIGFWVGGPIGAAVGAGVGLIASRYRIGPLDALLEKIPGIKKKGGGKGKGAAKPTATA
jgi:hypothetical protein